jgi:hypothetical protein
MRKPTTCMLQTLSDACTPHMENWYLRIMLGPLHFLGKSLGMGECCLILMPQNLSPLNRIHLSHHVQYEGRKP